MILTINSSDRITDALFFKKPSSSVRKTCSMLLRLSYSMQPYIHKVPFIFNDKFVIPNFICVLITQIIFTSLTAEELAGRLHYNTLRSWMELRVQYASFNISTVLFAFNSYAISHGNLEDCPYCGWGLSSYPDGHFGWLLCIKKETKKRV